MEEDGLSPEGLWSMLRGGGGGNWNWTNPWKDHFQPFPVLILRFALQLDKC